MPNIRKTVVRYLRKITLIMVLVILIVSVLLQILTVQRNAQESSDAIFHQIEQVLAENQSELEQLKEEYSEHCLKNAETIAYIIECHPEVLESVEELDKISGFVGVNEIHIFDKTGRIFMGTHPEYFDLTFDSGEQIGYFKPMLEDKSLKLCQEITPNTAESKLMQYSALWSENGEFIVQVGMEPVNVMKVTEKNELSYIFSLLRASSGETLYAIDKESGEIMGSSNINDVGKNLSEIGFDLDYIQKKNGVFHANINGVGCYCIFTESGDNLIGRVLSNDVLYQGIPAKIVELMVCLIIVAIILVVAVSRYMNKFVINGIYDVNEKLREISAGNLSEKVDVRSSLEFTELSSHINEMINSILASTDKISYILNKTNLNIGVYEYNENMKHVRFTEYIPKILSIDTEMAKRFASDYKLFKDHLDRLRNNPVDDEDGVFFLEGDTNHYIKIEEILRGSDTLGIVMDVTDEIVKLKKTEAERDIDLLTGLYNRRGLENNLSALFREPDKLGYGALIMIDADGLKEINDKYGHEKGDIYLKKISEVISSFARNSCICSRQGGDEFVLFLYNYPSETDLLDSIDTLKYIQNNSTAHLNSDLSVPLKFSFGYSMTKGKSDYQSLLKKADERMYASKSQRKKAAAQNK